MKKIIVALVILGVVGGMYFSSQESNTNKRPVTVPSTPISYTGVPVTVPDYHISDYSITDFSIPDIDIETEKQYCYHCKDSGLCSDCNGSGKTQQTKYGIDLIGGQDTSYTINIRCHLCDGSGKCIWCH